MCVECDGKPVVSITDCEKKKWKKKYCAGDITKTSSCMPSWSKWLIGNCSATKCNLTGQTIKSRKCLYGDRTEAANTDLCSSEFSSLTEKCKPIFVSLENLTKIVECNPFWSAWLITNCSSIGCNSTGNRVKTRKCLHGGGTETQDILMCSSQPEVIIQQFIAKNSNCSFLKTLNQFIIIGIGSGSVVLCIIGLCACVLKANTKLSKLL